MGFRCLRVSTGFYVAVPARGGSSANEVEALAVPRCSLIRAFAALAPARESRYTDAHE